MEKFNANCPICGKGFKVCRTCADHDLYSWKTVTDTESCFKVFTILHQYNVLKSITKDVAKEKLSKYDLAELESYPDNIKNLIKDIVGVKTESKTEGKKETVKTAFAKTEKKTTTK